ncbi:MAG TPA: RNA polymerase sigma factor [Acidobacteriaceae bacterium]|nr:RNA polymerase sigma factor [Acidobacteriaceae bacterium]
MGSLTVHHAGEPGSGTVAGSLDCEPAPSHVAPMTEAEFQRLYDATAGAIAGYLAAVTGRRDVADDLLQETYCRLLAQSYSGSQSRKLAGMDALATRRYLFRIATNLLRDRWRSGEDKPFAEPAEAAQICSFESSIDIRAMLTHLKPKERELLWLAYVEGMDHAEIAAATGLGRLSVRTLLFRARNKAKRFLSQGESL